jgi:adenylyltransferase/sulfurtransferase
MMENNPNRYQRQIQLPEFGPQAQEKLSKAKLLIIGAGGLGCPLLQYLAAAGVGHLGIADFDVVDISNLHRQILFSAQDIGQPKTGIAIKKLKILNDTIETEEFNTVVTNKNAIDIIQSYDIICDGTDHFISRYIINDACVILGKPLIYAGVFKHEMQLSVWNVKQEIGYSANYRDLFPNAEELRSIPSCNETGVLGTVTGVAGTLMAMECIKLITGNGIPLVNQIMYIHLLTGQFSTIQITPNPKTRFLIPENENEFKNKMYY